jgi:hypothetical protein
MANENRSIVGSPAPSTCPAPGSPLQHRNRRPRIAVPALVDRETGVETLGRKAPLDSAVRVFVDERLAVRLIVRRGLGVAVCGDA